MLRTQRIGLTVGAVALTLLLTTTTAQYISGAIASCADFDCPEPGDDVRWSLGDRAYGDAGMVPFETPLFAQNLTWTMAQSEVSAPETNDEDTIVHKDFYLGTPPDVDLRQSDYHACALFFLDSNATFPVAQPGEAPIPPGQCPSVIGHECVDALKQRADAAQMSSSSQDLCETLVKGLTDSVPEACAPVTNQSSWGQIEARPLTGSSAPRPISESQNSSSTAWPVIPSSYDLALILSSSDDFNVTDRRTITGTGQFQNTAIGAFSVYQAIPILTVFQPAHPQDDQEGSGSMSTSVSCLQAPPTNGGYLPESAAAAMGAGSFRAFAALFTALAFVR